MNNTQSGNPRQQTWAIWSLVLGILVFCTVGMTGPFAIWTGITSNRKREGSGMATAGIILGAVGSIIGFLWLLGAIAPRFYKAVDKASIQAAPQQSYDPYLTFAYVDSLLSSGRGADSYTDVQRDQNWEWLRGRRVQWSGVVSEVYDRGGTCRVSLRCGSQTRTSDTSFDLPRDQALRLHKDQRLTVQGTLASHGMFGYDLSSARIVLW